MQARNWTSTNNKWEIEFLGNVSKTSDSGVYVLLVEDMVNSPMKDIVNVAVTVTRMDNITAHYEINTSAKLPKYVLDQVQIMVNNARWLGLEPTTEAQDDVIADVLRKTPAPMLAHVDIVPAAQEAIAAASEDKGLQIDSPVFLEDLSQAQFICRSLGLVKGYVDCTEGEAVLRMAKDVHYIANATAQLKTRADYTYVIEVTTAATEDKKIMAVTISPDGQAVVLEQEQPAPVEVQNFMNLTAAERIQAVPAAGVESWVVFQRFLDKWGDMLQRVKSGTVNCRELSRFVYTERVYQYDVTIQAAGGPTTRLAQLLNRGDIYRDEFLSLALRTMEKTVEHADIACRVLVTALTPWLLEKWDRYNDTADALQQDRIDGRITQEAYAQERIAIQRQYGLSEAEVLMAMQAGIISN